MSPKKFNFLSLSPKKFNFLSHLFFLKRDCIIFLLKKNKRPQGLEKNVKKQKKCLFLPHLFFYIFVLHFFSRFSHFFFLKKNVKKVRKMRKINDRKSKKNVYS